MTDQISEQNGSNNVSHNQAFFHHPRQPDLPSIRDYYDETWLDYRMLWLNPQNKAIHFGYWDERTRSHGESLLNMNRVLASHIGISKGMRVLDAGCGIGGSSIWLAQTYGVEVVGITPVASQVERARRYAQKQGIADQVSFEQQDYMQTTFPQASFDVVWGMESFCHAPDKQLVLAEVRRLLRPGGRLGIVEYMRNKRPLAEIDEALLHSWLSGWAIPDISTSHEWLGWAQEAGFQDTQLADITSNVRPSLRRLYRLAILARPGANTLYALGLRSKTQQGNMRGAFDQYRALQRDLWFYALLTATANQD
jgi:cyclopropane fatty-acyl-phospholipid synthase-like methyltransferase